MNKKEALKLIKELERVICEDGIALEDHNFRVDSNGWKKITVDGEGYLVNPEGDIWEIINGECGGEQLFTWNSAMRETKKAGKRMPTDEEFTELLKTKEDMPNLILAGYRSTDGSFSYRLTSAHLWSSSQYAVSYAWGRDLDSGNSTVNRGYGSKAYGFSARCLKEWF